MTPDEIRSVDLARAWLGGYRRRAVEPLLTEVAAALEQVTRERDRLTDRIQELEAEAAGHRELEALLRSTLATAERAAQETKEQARRESDLLVREAHAESRRITRETTAEKRRLEEDVRRIRAQLVGAFEMLETRSGVSAPRAMEEAAVAEPTLVDALDGEARSALRRGITA